MYFISIYTTVDSDITPFRDKTRAWLLLDFKDDKKDFSAPLEFLKYLPFCFHIVFQSASPVSKKVQQTNPQWQLFLDLVTC